VPLDAATLGQRHVQMLDKLAASESRIEAAFTFFLRKRTPVSGVQSLLDYQGPWISETRGGVTSIHAEAGVPVESVCPYSKEISDYRAHNQRSLVTIRVEVLGRIGNSVLQLVLEDAPRERLPAGGGVLGRACGFDCRRPLRLSFFTFICGSLSRMFKDGPARRRAWIAAAHAPDC